MADEPQDEEPDPERAERIRQIQARLREETEKRRKRLAKKTRG